MARKRDYKLEGRRKKLKALAQGRVANQLMQKWGRVEYEPPPKKRNPPAT